jgi:hypothetical protein
MAASNEGCEDEDHEEEEDALGKLMEMVKSLTADIESIEKALRIFQSLRRMFLTTLLMMIALKIS